MDREMRKILHDVSDQVTDTGLSIGSRESWTVYNLNHLSETLRLHAKTLDIVAATIKDAEQK